MSKKEGMSISLQDDQILLKKYLKSQIMYPEIKFKHHIQEHLHMLDLIKCTIKMGESNSILLIGSRGSGKTMLINNVLKEISCAEDFEENIIVVNLHGLIHTDDRLALKDATRQMQLENIVGGKVFGTFAENLNFLIESLKLGDKKCSKPIIFILDEFDLFCTHHNQTLLYNLFDVAQSAQAPICVIGVTCRLDVIELLEKRVKSRFSHRQIFLYPGNMTSLEPFPFQDRLEFFQNLLSLPAEANSNEISIANIYSIDSKYRTQWNRQIKNLRNNLNVINVLKQMYSSDKSERKFRIFLATFISTLCVAHQELKVSDFICSSKLFSQNEKIAILGGLSILEMCLIIAMQHETEIYDDESLNFEKIWNRYLKFVSQNSSIKTVQRPVVIKAFEHIKSLELIIPLGSNHKIEKEYQPYKFTLTSQQVMDTVKNFPSLPTDVFQWAANSIS